MHVYDCQVVTAERPEAVVRVIAEERNDLVAMYVNGAKVYLSRADARTVAHGLAFAADLQAARVGKVF